jgi:quercetin dioxygenase-like cupin family protein
MVQFSRFLAVLVLLVVTVTSERGITLAAQDATPASTPTVTREVINEGLPDAATGQILQLVRYTIPGNIALDAHTHPGMQVNVVESGTLTYTVVEGEMEITRADGSSEILRSGETTDLKPGDVFTEPEGMVHFGENRSDEPIVLLSASLLEADEPPSSPAS